MENRTIAQILKKRVKCFINVVSNDDLQNKIRRSGCYILNTAPSHKVFGHFIVLIYDCVRDILTVWDSLGKNYPFLNVVSTNIVYESKSPVQSKYSTLCALYVIYCLLCVSVNKSFKYINSRFDKHDMDVNDRNVYIWFVKNNVIPKKILPNFTNSNLLDREIYEMCL
jgi:hypothetical protein